METPGLRPSFLAGSVATALSVYGPLFTMWVSMVRLQLELVVPHPLTQVASPILESLKLPPVTRNSRWFVVTSSVDVAVSVCVPLNVAPLLGDVIVGDGGVRSR